MTTRAFRPLLAVLLLAGLLVPLPGAAGPVGSSTLTIAVDAEAPTEVLYGRDVTLSTTVSNTSGEFGYNLTVVETLPPGATYTPTPPSSAGDPTDQFVLADGSTVLVWSNIGDIAANSTFTLTYGVELAQNDPGAPGDPFLVGADLERTAVAHLNDVDLVREVTDYAPNVDNTAVDVDPATYSAVAGGSSTTQVTAIEIRKDQGATEGEMLRGVHDHRTTYTLTVVNNDLVPSADTIVVDHLPAGLEYLGCGDADNTTNAPTHPGNTDEYTGAGSLAQAGIGGDCLHPTSVETLVVDPDAAGPAEAGLYTRITWDLGPLLVDLNQTDDGPGDDDLGPGEELRITYAAGIPLRENTATWDATTGEPATTALVLGDLPPQAANLDNNRGPEVTDEARLTNFAAASAEFLGEFAPGSDNRVGASTSLDRSAEDLSIHKCADDGSLVEGSTRRFGFVIETSEYRSASGISFTEVLPDGFAPNADVTWATGLHGGAEQAGCDAAPQANGGAWTSALEQADGTWLIDFDSAGIPALTGIGASSWIRISFSADALDNYREGGADDVPIASNDAVTNTARDLVGTTAVIPAAANDDASDLGDTAFVQDEGDESSVALAAGGPTLLKEVAAAQPSVATDCSDIGTWLADGPTPSYRPGDLICYRLTVTFPAETHTKDVTVLDFLPPGSTLVTDSMAEGSGNTATIAAVAVVDDVMEFTLGQDASAYGDTGTTDGDSLWVAPGAVFQFTFAVTAQADPDVASDADLTENLMKLSWLNTAGASFNARAAATHNLVQPFPTIAKGVLDVNDGSPNDPPADDVTVVAGDVVTYRITVGNAGAADAVDVVTTDTLPTGLDCTAVTLPVVALPDAVDCTGSTLTWAVAALGAGATADLDYDVTIPATVSAGAVLDNTATTDTWANETNQPEDTVYVDGPTDSSAVSVEDIVVSKGRTTQVADGSANDPASEATIGEVISYTIGATVPDGSSVYDAEFTDSLVDVGGPTAQQAWTGSAVTVTWPDATTFTSTATDCTDPAASPAAGDWTGFALCVDGTAPSQTVRLVFPTTYTNPTASGDDLFIIDFDTVVTDVGANRRGRDIDNRADFSWAPAEGGASRTASSDVVSTLIVEPALTITKDEDDTDDIVAPGQSIEYTITVTNASGTGVARAHDLVVTDQVPSELTVTAVPDPDGVDPRIVVTDGTGPDLAWTITELAPGASVALTYTVEVSGTPLAGADYTNTAGVTSTSLAGSVAGERDTNSPYTVGYEATTSDTVSVSQATLVKTGDTSRAVGDVTTFTVTATIPVGAVLYDAVVEDTLPAGLRYLDLTSAACTAGCDPVGGDRIEVTSGNVDNQAGKDLAWTLSAATAVADLSEDRVVTIVYRAYVEDVLAASAGAELVNDAHLVWNDAAGDPFGDVSSVATTTVLEPDLTIVKTVDPEDAVPGDTLTYTLTITNATGPNVGTAHDVAVSDVADDPQFDVTATADSGLPAGVALTSTGTSAPFTWTIDEIPAGGEVVLTYTATLDASADLSDGDQLDNTATIDAYASVDTDTPPTGIADLERTYGPDEDSVTVDLGFPALTYDKAVGPQGAAADVGIDFTWVITLANTGDAPALNVDVADTLPVNWTYTGNLVVAVDGTPVGPTPLPTVGGTNPDTLAWDDIVASLAPGAVLTISYTATPELAAQDIPGTGLLVPHTNAATASAEDASGETGNADGDYGTNADDGSTDPAEADAFLPLPATVGDTLWLDLDADGVRDAGWETDHGGIGGVTVTLTGVDNGVVLTTVTAGDGTYLFEDVPPGDYTVTVDVADPQFPADVVPTYDGDDTDTSATIDTPNESDVTVAAEEENLDQDFGYRGDGRIGDTIWLDLDRDGTQNGLEPGIGGVTVELLDVDGNVVATATTASDGTYLFTNLPDGDWTVRVTPPTGTDNTGDPDTPTTPTVFGDSESNVTLADGSRVNEDQDFGYAGTLSIGDTVWYDLDGDGLQDLGWEADHGGIAGVTVTLLDADGDAIAVTTTGTDGTYAFDNLPPGEYTVEVDSGDIPGTVVQTVDADDGAGPFVTPDASTTTLVDADDDGQDFGYRGTGSIGDTVWLDLDADGTVNGDEIGLEGILVTLADAAGNTVATTTTDAAGGYLFDHLPPGEWTVTITPPAGHEPTFDGDDTDTTVAIVTPNTATVDLADGEDDEDQDFGLNGTGSIGDRIWLDLDGDGVQDDLEPGLSDVVVRLELDGVVVATTTTVDGAYLFDNLPPGDYRVVVDDTTLPPGFEPTNDPDDDTIDNEADVTLGIGEDDLAQDFGYQGDGQIGDRVWLDRDLDGVQDPSEPGIAGVTVRLYDGGGDLVAEVVTDGFGRYTFGGLVDDTYRVVVDDATLPGGVTQTYDDDDGATSTFATPHESAATIDVDGTTPIVADLDQDFGYVGDLSLGDRIWLDLDADGVQDDLEPGIPGVTVQLIDPASGLVVDEAVTGTDGAYLFTNLDPREWQVVVVTDTLPEGLHTTGDADGVDTPDTSTTTLVDADDLEQDFGYAGDLSIGDLVWFDVDADGIADDGEPGIAGIVVELYDGDVLVATTTTADDGTYAFGNLPPGDWTVSLDVATIPAGLRQTADDDGLDTPTTSTTSLVDADDMDQDFGFTGTSSIGDRVFADNDLDGIQGDPSVEPGVPGVTVELSLADDPDTVIATTVTDADGNYRFENLRPDDYLIRVIPPDGTVITPAVDAGDDDAVDSDVDPDTGVTEPITLPADTDIDTVDAGVVDTGSIGDLVFDDRDGDGIQDDDEPGVDAIVVILLDGDGTEIDRTVTDEDGSYVFDDLLPGDYEIRIDLPEDVDFTLPGQGDPATDSNTDPATGRTGIITLEPGEDDDTVDAGLRFVGSLAVTKRLLDDGLVVGNEATYRISITNDGRWTIPGPLTLTDDLPDALLYLDVDGDDGWDCTHADGLVTCLWSEPLAPGDELVLDIVVGVVGPASAPIANVVDVSSVGVVLPPGGFTATSAPMPVTDPPVTPPAGGGDPGGTPPLANTGASVVWMVALALLLVGAGNGLLVATGRGRRRRRTT